MKKAAIVALFVLLGIVAGAGGDHVAGSLQAAHPLIRSAYEVNRSQWVTYTNKEYGIEIALPKTFTISEETGSLVIKDASGTPLPTITLTKLRETVQKAMAPFPTMLQGGWKVLDRTAYVLVTPYYSVDATTISSTYLFARDFPVQGTTSPTVIIEATIEDELKNPAYTAARLSGIEDTDAVLTPAEQIVSTLRFLSYDEIYGPAGKEKK